MFCLWVKKLFGRGIIHHCEDRQERTGQIQIRYSSNTPSLIWSGFFFFFLRQRIVGDLTDWCGVMNRSFSQVFSNISDIRIPFVVWGMLESQQTLIAMSIFNRTPTRHNRWKFKICSLVVLFRQILGSWSSREMHFRHRFLYVSFFFLEIVDSGSINLIAKI